MSTPVISSEIACSVTYDGKAKEMVFEFMVCAVSLVETIPSDPDGAQSIALVHASASPTTWFRAPYNFHKDEHMMNKIQDEIRFALDSEVQTHLKILGSLGFDIRSTPVLHRAPLDLFTSKVDVSERYQMEHIRHRLANVPKNESYPSVAPALLRDMLEHGRIAVLAQDAKVMQRLEQLTDELSKIHVNPNQPKELHCGSIACAAAVSAIHWICIERAHL